MSDGAYVTLSRDEEWMGKVEYDIEHIELDGGETQLIRVTFDMETMTATVDFYPDQGEDFVVAMRDAIEKAGVEQ